MATKYHVAAIAASEVGSCGLPLEVRPIAEAEVRAADEIWVTSSTKEVLAVGTLDERAVGGGKPGPVFRRMHELYQDFKRSVMREAA